MQEPENSDAGGGGGRDAAAAAAEGSWLLPFTHEFKAKQSLLLQEFRGKEAKSMQTLCLNLNEGNLHCVRRYENKMRPRLDIMLVSSLPQVQSVTPDPLCPAQWLPATCGSAVNT